MATNQAGDGVTIAKELCLTLFALSNNAISLDYELSTFKFLEQLSSGINSTCGNPPSELTQLSEVKHNLITTLESHPSVLNERIHHGAGLLHMVMLMHFPGRMEILKLFRDIDGFDANIRDDDLRTPLHYALSIFNVGAHIKENPHPDSCGSLFDIVKFLTDSGAYVDPIDTLFMKLRPIHLRFVALPKRYGYVMEMPEIVKLLIASSTYRYAEHYTSSKPIINRALSAVIRSSTGLVSKILVEKLSFLLSFGALGLLDNLEKEYSSARGARDIVRFPEGATDTWSYLVSFVLLNRPKKHNFMALAIRSGKFDIVKSLPMFLQIGADIRLPDVISYIKNADDFDILSHLGLNVTQLDRRGNNAFHHLHKVPSNTILRMIGEWLMDQGGSINCRNSDGKTPLHCFLEHDASPEYIETLIDFGAMVNIQDFKGIAPLRLAIRRSRNGVNMEKQVDMLLSAGADYSLLSKHNKSVLYLALEGPMPRSTVLVEKLLSIGCDPNVPDYQGNSPLHLAYTYDVNESVIKLLLDHGANINAPNKNGDTPLHFNVCRFCINLKINLSVSDIMDYFIKFDPFCQMDRDRNSPNNQGMTPQHSSCGKNLEELFSGIRLLLDRGADINARNNDHETPLTSYFKSGVDVTCLRIDLCKFLISQGANVNLKNKKGMTPLLMGCSVGKVDAPLLRLLLDHGADINGLDPLGNSPIHLIIKNDSCMNVYDVLKLFVERGININLPDNEGMTPLHLACGGKLEEPYSTIRLLLDHGANIDAQDKFHNSPLMRYIESGTAKSCIRIDICKLLISPGANVNLKNMNGMTPLLIACSGKKIDEPLIRLLLDQGADINVQDRMGDSPIHLIIKNDSCMNVYDVLKLFVERGININLPDNEGMTPLHLACGGKLEEPYSTIRLLLDHGTNIDAQDKFHNTPLMTYINSGTTENCIRTDLCKLLISLGANVNLKTMNGMTPLLIACSGKKVDESILRLLLDQGADINVQDPKGNSPIHVIIKNDSCMNVYDVLKLFVERGININLPDNEGMTPLHLACGGKLMESYLRLLLNHDANINAQNRYLETPLMRYIKSATTENCIRTDLCKYLISPGVNVNFKNKGGMTPLLIACSGKKVSEPLLRLLLDQGADINAQNQMGDSPVHLIIRNCSSWDVYDVLKLLITRGININLPNNQGITPLHVACSSKLKEPCFRLLLDHGAILNARDKMGFTPLMLTISYDVHNFHLLPLLITRGANVNSINAEGNTLLHLCCMYPSDKFSLDVLLDFGAVLNAQNNKGDTPLHLLNARGYTKRPFHNQLRLLLSRGANLMIKNHQGKTAFEHCSNEIRDIDESTVPLAFHAASTKYSLDDREHMLRLSARNWSKFPDNFKRHLASALELKKLCLPNRSLSVYDFLMLSDLDTVRLPRKPSLQEDLKKILAMSSICAPYQELIANKMKSCEKAKEILCKAQEALNIILLHHALPSLVIDKILSYLREKKDLLQIIKTVFPDD